MNKTDLEQAIGYHFKDDALFEQALTHRSFIGNITSRSIVNNERLEFLGDAFFDAVVSEHLYKTLKDVEEGRLTKMRSLIVCKHSLAERGRNLGINLLIRLGKGEEHNRGRYRESIIADTMEAIIGAVYLDGGWESVQKVVLKVFAPTIDAALSGKLYNDYKTVLQEELQGEGITDIRYSVEKEEGPDHKKTFL